MADYQEYQYTFKDSTDNDVICTLPIFAGFDGMYPIALL
jgi:hypothetical protein